MMTETNNEPAETKPRSREWSKGVVLIVIGVLLLLGQLAREVFKGEYFLPALGLVFLIAGCVTRKSGWLVPGGILTGLGVGVYLMELWGLENEAAGGVVLLSFGAGWMLTTVLSLLFATERLIWPLIPGTILALIGAALLMGTPGLAALAFLGQAWPVALILVGLYLILWRRGIGK